MYTIFPLLTWNSLEIYKIFSNKYTTFPTTWCEQFGEIAFKNHKYKFLLMPRVYLASWSIGKWWKNGSAFIEKFPMQNNANKHIYSFQRNDIVRKLFVEVKKQKGGKWRQLVNHLVTILPLPPWSLTFVLSNTLYFHILRFFPSFLIALSNKIKQIVKLLCRQNLVCLDFILEWDFMDKIFLFSSR